LPYLDLRATGASPYDKVCVMELPYSHAVLNLVMKKNLF